MNTAMNAVMASALALATAWPAAAQYAPYRPTQTEQDLQRYQQEHGDYRTSDQIRQDQRRAAWMEYQRRLNAYERARADYDARWGYGAYARTYGPAPMWSESRWAEYAPPYVPDAVAPAAPSYGSNTAYGGTAIRCDKSGTVAAGALGALAGAVLGSNVAARNARTEGAVLGGLVGAGIGAAIGRSHDRYKCDERGPYFSYNETIPYREGREERGARYSYYRQMGCRLASAPIDSSGRDYRYVRVCPDPEGRYRILG